MGKNEAGECCPECKTDVEKGREILAQLHATISKPEWREHLAKFNGNRPIVRRQPLSDFEVSFEIVGKKGDVIEISKPAECHCRAEKLIAADTCENIGSRMKVFIGSLPEGRENKASPTKDWAADFSWMRRQLRHVEAG